MRSLPLEKAIDACASIGFRQVELATMPDWPADPAGLSAAARHKLREHLQANAVRVPALMENLSLAVDDAVQRTQLDRLRRVAGLGRDIDPDESPLIETVVGGKVGEWDKLKSTFVKRLNEWARVAESEQTILCIKPHRFGAMNTPADGVWLARQVNSPWIKLAYDFSHFDKRDGLSMESSIATMLPLVRFVHVKDVKLEGGKAQFLLPGEGDTDYVRLFKELLRQGYSGCVCVEASAMVQKRPNYDPIAAARSSYHVLVTALDKARRST